MSRWNPVYWDSVLEPDFRYARGELFDHFLDALITHALGLQQVGMPDAAAAVTGLRALRLEPVPAPDPAVEDLFFALDRRLAQLTPAGAGALRTAMSRNDLDMTVYRLSARGHLLGALADVNALRAQVLQLAAEETQTLILAHTHHQPAQPTTLAHYLAAAENVLSRDAARFREAWARVNLSPLGAVALSGSSHSLDRPFTAALLGMERPIENTYDAVSSGDWQLELGGAVCACAATLSRVLHDLLSWASQGLISLADGLVQGSSVMPQKRNPVALEHARARFSRALGYAQAVTFSNHNVPFGDINDPGTDVQEPLNMMWRDFRQGLRLLTTSLDGLQIERERWAREAASSDAALTELADALARQPGGDFRTGHAQAQTLLLALRAQGRPLSSATDADLAALGVTAPAGTVAAALDARRFVESRRTLGGPASEVVRAHLDTAQGRLAQDQAWHAGRLAQVQQAEGRLRADAATTNP